MGNFKIKRHLFILPILLFVFTSDLHAAFNKHEIKVITEAIEESFRLLIDTWNEELYFEMYDFGQKSSQKRLSRGEFAQRMVDLKWKPTLKPIKIDRIDILYHNYAVIYFWQEFENKVNTLNKIEKYMIFPVILETNKWNFDLTQLIRIPYEGKFQKPESDTQQNKPEEKSGSAVEGSPPEEANQ